MAIDVRMAHVNPTCEGDVYINLLEESGGPPDYVCEVGTLAVWV